MNHLLLLRDTGDLSQKYEVVWGNYYQEELLEDVILEQGTYIFANLGSQAVHPIQLLF